MLKEKISEKFKEIKSDINYWIDVTFTNPKAIRSCWKWSKRIGIGCVGFALACTVTVPKSEYNTTVDKLNSKYESKVIEYEDMEAKYKDKEDKYKDEIDRLTYKLDLLNNKTNNLEEKTKEYTSLTPEEKKVIDEKIVEVKQETKDKIAAEKAQKEAELKAEEEAKKKAEEEAQAEEQAKAEAQAQAKVQQEQEIQQNNQTQMVWKSETGSKYHSIPNCGRMNPNNATHITLEQAQSLGLGRCSKCF